MHNVSCLPIKDFVLFIFLQPIYQAGTCKSLYLFIFPSSLMEVWRTKEFWFKIDLIQNSKQFFFERAHPTNQIPFMWALILGLSWLYSKAILGSVFGGLYVVPGVEPELATSKSSTLTPVSSLWTWHLIPNYIFFFFLNYIFLCIPRFPTLLTLGTNINL